MNSYYAYTESQPFDTVNGKVVLNLKKGDLNKPGTFQVSATSVGGGSFSKDVTLEDNPWISTLNVAIPEVYDGTAVAVESAKVGIITTAQTGSVTVDGQKIFSIKLKTGQTLEAKCTAKGANSAAKYKFSIE